MNRLFERRQREKYENMRERADESYPWVAQVQDFRVWVAASSRFWRPNSVHHIMGRGAPERYHWFCNLICTSDSCHSWGHVQSPPQFEICCLRAKMESELVRVKKKLPEPDEERYRIWMPDVMAKNIGRASLSGRIEELVGRCKILDKSILMFAEDLKKFLG